MNKPKKFWPKLYSFQYIFTGLFGFVLQTREWYEVMIRLTFIFLGFLTLLNLDKPLATARILTIGAYILGAWVLFGLLVILRLPETSLTRTHLFYMPLWFGWLVGHFWVIKDLRRL